MAELFVRRGWTTWAWMMVMTFIKKHRRIERSVFLFLCEEMHLAGGDYSFACMSLLSRCVGSTHKAGSSSWDVRRRRLHIIITSGVHHVTPPGAEAIFSLSSSFFSSCRCLRHSRFTCTVPTTVHPRARFLARPALLTLPPCTLSPSSKSSPAEGVRGGGGRREERAPHPTATSRVGKVARQLPPLPKPFLVHFHHRYPRRVLVATAGDDDAPSHRRANNMTPTRVTHGRQGLPPLTPVEGQRLAR
jgi:hypothetical protein